MQKSEAITSRRRDEPQRIVSRLRSLAERQLPEAPRYTRTLTYDRELEAWHASCRHHLDALACEGGRLVADACEAGCLPDVAYEVEAALRDVQARGADAASLKVFFIHAASWFSHYQGQGHLPHIEHRFIIEDEDEREYDPRRRFQPPEPVLPRERYNAQHEWLQATLLAFSDVIEATCSDDWNRAKRPYAVRTGSTLKCVMADSHLAAAAITLGGLLIEHRAQLPQGCIEDTLTVVAHEDGEEKVIEMQDCIRYMILLDLTEKNALGRVLP